MAHFISYTSVLTIVMLLVLSSKKIRAQPSCNPMDPKHEIPVYEQDIDMAQFAMNLEYLEGEWFLWSSLGYGLDKIAPELTNGGPPPIGAQKANLDPLTQRIITEFAYEEVGHLRVINKTFGGIPRPLLDLRASNFEKFVDEAFGYPLFPPFDPYRDGLSYMMAAYIVPYMGLVGYVGTIPNLQGYWSRRVVAGLLGVEAGQDAVIRTYLFERAEEVVHPYNFTVAEFTNRISELRNHLAMCGIKDEGIIVPKVLGAEERIMTNILSANRDSISYRRTPGEILRVLYDSGNEHVPGGFYPHGGNGKVAKSFLEYQMRKIINMYV